jgi:hypothetical protein
MFSDSYFRVEGNLPPVSPRQKSIFMMLVTQIEDVDKDNLMPTRQMLGDIAARVNQEKQQGRVTFGIALNCGGVQLPPASVLMKDYRDALQEFDYVVTPAANRIEAMLSQIIGLGTGINIHTNRTAQTTEDFVHFIIQVMKDTST